MFKQQKNNKKFSFLYFGQYFILTIRKDGGEWKNKTNGSQEAFYSHNFQFSSSSQQTREKVKLYNR